MSQNDKKELRKSVHLVCEFENDKTDVEVAYICLQRLTLRNIRQGGHFG